jgi:L-asparaginase II
MLALTVGAALEPAQCGVDGCSVPTWAVPLSALARGFARLATGEGLPGRAARAAEAARTAMMAAPHLVAGTGRFCTEMMAATGGRAVLKTGAEGVMCAGLPGRGLGLAVKCDDGAARAAETAMAHLLAVFGAADADHPVVRRYLTRPLVNAAGRHIGDLRASAALSEALAGGRSTAVAWGPPRLTPGRCPTA